MTTVWHHNAYGYHGDDGRKFHTSCSGEAYGPPFTTGDVIGCGINFLKGTAFYTKNGHNLGERHIINREMWIIIRISLQKKHKEFIVR